MASASPGSIAHRRFDFHSQRILLAKEAISLFSDMDERHWWIAAKVEQAFSIDKSSTTGASFTETFFRRPDVLEKINYFLFAKGSNKLFFYTTRDRFPSKDISCCLSLIDDATFVNEPLDNIILLFFIRSDTSSDVTISPVSDIHWGEIKHPTQMMSLLYSQTLLPLFKKELSSCSTATYQQASTKATIIAQMEKQVDGISHTCQALQKDKNLVSTTRGEGRRRRTVGYVRLLLQLLKRADAELLAQLKQATRSTADSPVIRNCETLVLLWIATIENILQDIFSDE